MTLTRVSRFATERKSRCLFHWRPDVDPLRALTGQEAVFTRAGPATGIAANGRLYTAAHDQPRIVYGGGEPALLLEDGATNIFTHSEDMSGPPYVNDGTVTITTNAMRAPDGATTADAMVETATTSTHYAYRGITLTADAPQSCSVFVKPALRFIGQLYLTAGANLVGFTFNTVLQTVSPILGGGGVLSASGMQAVGDGWYRLWFVGAVGGGVTSAALVLQLLDGTGANTYAGDTSEHAMYAWGWQHEQDRVVVTSYMPTNAVAATTRAADTMYFPFNAPPQPMTLYAKIRQLMYPALLSSTERIVEISSGLTPHVLLYYSGGGINQISAWFSDGVIALSSNLTPAGAIGDVVEAVCVFGESGQGFSVHGEASVNAAAKIVAVLDERPYRALPAAFGSPRIYINSGGAATRAVNEFRAVKVAAGIRTLEEMRAML